MKMIPHCCVPTSVSGPSFSLSVTISQSLLALWSPTYKGKLAEEPAKGLWMMVLLFRRCVAQWLLVVLKRINFMASSMSVLDKLNPTLWLATLAGKMFCTCMSCPAGLPTVSQRCAKIPKRIWKISEDITHLAPVPSCAFPLHFLLMGLLAFFAGRSGNSREYTIIEMSFGYFFPWYNVC